MPPQKKRAELSSQERATIAKSAKSINLNSNPFENIKQTRKKAIMGTTNTQVRHTSKARSNDINVRKDTLLKDFWKQQKPSNKFVDKRQLAFEKTLNKVDNKRKKFQIGEDDEDEMDTNLKRTKLSSFSSLGDIDEGIDKDLFKDDYQLDDIDSKYSTRDEVSVLRNLKGIGRGEVSSTFGFEQQVERKLSRREKMNMRIRGFKERKMEQKMEKEDNLDMIELLDNDEDLMKLLKTEPSKNESTTNSNPSKSLDYDKFFDMIKKGEEIDLNTLTTKKKEESFLKQPTKVSQDEEDLENTQSSDEKDESENVEDSYAQDSFIDDTPIVEDEEQDDEEEEQEETKEIAQDEEDIQDEDDEQEEQDGEENSYIQDSFINDEAVVDEEEEQEGLDIMDEDDESGLETTEKDLEELSVLITSNNGKVQEKLMESIEKNDSMANEKLFATIVTMLAEQVGFGEWLSEKSKVNFNNLLNDLTQVLFKLTTRQPNTAHDIFHLFLLSTFNKYEDQEVPNLGELVTLKIILTVYPLKDRIESPILSLTNLLIHLYLEKYSKFLTSPMNTRAILFLVSLAVSIDTECKFYSPDVINTLKEVITRKETTKGSDKKKSGKKHNLFKSIYNANEECSCNDWAKHLISIYSNHLEKDFSKTVSSNDHFKKLLGSEGFSNVSRDHIENFNIIFEGIKLNEKPIQIEEVKTTLNYKTKKPRAIAQFEPLLFGDNNGNIDSMKSKYTDENPEQTKLKTLRKKISREKRKAMSELRKDNQFLRTAREQIEAKEAFERKKKYKDVIDTLRGERMEQNQLDRKNREIEKMKKDMRTNRKNAGKLTAANFGGRSSSDKK